MRKLLMLATFFVATCMAVHVSAQGWVWATGTSNISSDSSFIESGDIAVDKSGNVYEIGYGQAGTIGTRDTLNSFGPFIVVDTENQGYQSVLVSTDSNGVYRWVLATQHAQVSFSHMSIDPYGNIYILGHTQGSFTFGNLAFTFTMSFSTFEYFCAKVNSAGQVLWIKDMAPGALIQSGLAINSSGHLYMVGTFDADMTLGATTLTHEDSAGYTLFYAKFDSSGLPLWAKKSSGKAYVSLLNQWAFTHSIAVADDSTFYIAGNCTATTSEKMIIGTDTITAHDTPTYFVARFNATGVPLWTKQANYIKGSNLVDRLNSITVDANDNVYLAGGHRQQFTFGSDTLQACASTLRSAMFVTKYNSSGSEIWARGFAQPQYATAFSISADHCGNIWVSGGKSEGLVNDSLFLLQFDTTGTKINSMWLTGGGDDMSNIAFDYKGNMFLGGDFYVSTVNFGNDTITKTPKQLESLFIAKYRYDYPGCVPDHSAGTSIIENPVSPTISLYPNPASAAFTIHSDAPLNVAAHAEIYDMTGRMVIAYPLNEETTEVPLENIATGIYQCSIINNGLSFVTKKLVVIK